MSEDKRNWIRLAALAACLVASIFFNGDPAMGLAEDDPNWDCRVMGNGLCGADIISQSYDTTYRILNGPF